MSINPGAFEKAVEAAGSEPRMNYHGRGGFVGNGFEADCLAQALCVCVALGRLWGELARVLPHHDSMGLGVIVAWPAELFK